jgi:hypothetical protein
MVDPNVILMRIDIDSEIHKIGHLRRSQEELMAELSESPNDSDFIEAYFENKEVISKKLHNVKMLKARLLEIDPAFSFEQKIIDALNIIDPMDPGFLREILSLQNIQADQEIQGLDEGLFL